jgi:hypothetical protein
VGTLGDEEWDYYRRCEAALLQLNSAVSWSALAVVLLGDDEERDSEPNKQGTVDD